MSTQTQIPGEKPKNGGIDYTYASDRAGHLSIGRWFDGDKEAWWGLACEAENTMIAALPEQYRPDEPRFR